MRKRSFRGRPRPFVMALCAVIVVTTAAPVRAASPQLFSESVHVTVPALIVFDVADVAVATEATAATPVLFNSAALSLGHRLRISVKAEGDITPPSGAPIPASTVSWRTSNVSGGVGINGVLSKTIYTPVFQGDLPATSGQFDIEWTLAAPGTGIRAGTHQVVLRWKIESVIV